MDIDIILLVFFGFCSIVIGLAQLFFQIWVHVTMSRSGHEYFSTCDCNQRLNSLINMDQKNNNTNLIHVPETWV